MSACTMLLGCKGCPVTSVLGASPKWELLQVEKMANTPINPNIHLDNDLMGKSYKAAVRFFHDDFPDDAKLYIIAGDQDQIVDPLQARPKPCWKDVCASFVTFTGGEDYNQIYGLRIAESLAHVVCCTIWVMLGMHFVAQDRLEIADNKLPSQIAVLFTAARSAVKEQRMADIELFTVPGSHIGFGARPQGHVEFSVITVAPQIIHKYVMDGNSQAEKHVFKAC